LSYFDKLPNLALGNVVSYLNKYDSYSNKYYFLDGLMSAYPALGGRIRHGVSWRTIGDEDEPSLPLLDVLRSLLLTSVESTVNFNVDWRPQDEGTYRKWKNLLTSKYLRRVVVGDPRVLLGEKISDDVRTLKITLPVDLHREVVWPLFKKSMFVPASLEKVETEAGYAALPMSLVSSGAEFFALFSAVPKLYFYPWNPRPEFWDGFETFDNVVELSVNYDDWSEYQYSVPLDRFVNLRKLQMRGIAENLLDFDVVLPRLRTLELMDVFESAFQQNIWEHLARLVPNLVNLRIDGHFFPVKGCPRQTLTQHGDLCAVTIPEHFTCLEKLNIAVALEFSSVLDMVDRFEAVRPGGVKEVKVDGFVYYARSECVNVSAKVARWVKQKRRQNRKMAFDVWVRQGRLSIADRPPFNPSYLFKFSQP
jgi:hypothetical protein